MRYLLLLMLIAACMPSKEHSRCITSIGKNSWQMEVAKTDEERSRGLMYRAFMPDDQGMVFVFEKPQEIAMWMKNTQIALDMVFIGEDRRVFGFHENAQPNSEDVIRTGGKTRYLLELNAAQIKTAGIKKGDKVTFTDCAL
jgi:uncharacterized membrane protein (UPF0127 family)